jgi:GR25 family glycosyltransferase involved in LPS biosynthesis
MTNYIISLKEPIQKMEYLQSQGINTTWIEGINGKEVDKNYVKNHFVNFYSNFGPSGSIGCSLSHLKTWKTFLESGKDYCIIFEDDVVLKKNFTKRFKRALKYTPNDYDILYLGNFGGTKNKNFFTIMFDFLQISSEYRQINKYIAKPKVALGAHAYVLSKKGAEKLIRLLDKNIDNHIDYCIQNLVSKNLITTYTVTPRLAYQTSTDTTNSLNVSNSHPFIITDILSNFYLDKMVRASYISTVSLLQIPSTLNKYKLYITPTTLFFLIISFILTFLEISLEKILLSYIILSLPDIYRCDFIYTVFHLIFLITIPLIFS